MPGSGGLRLLDERRSCDPQRSVGSNRLWDYGDTAQRLRAPPEVHAGHRVRQSPHASRSIVGSAGRSRWAHSHRDGACRERASEGQRVLPVLRHHRAHSLPSLLPCRPVADVLQVVLLGHSLCTERILQRQDQDQEGRHVLVLRQRLSPAAVHQEGQADRQRPLPVMDHCEADGPLHGRKCTDPKNDSYTARLRPSK